MHCFDTVVADTLHREGAGAGAVHSPYQGTAPLAVVSWSRGLGGDRLAAALTRGLEPLALVDRCNT